MQQLQFSVMEQPLVIIQTGGLWVTLVSQTVQLPGWRVVLEAAIVQWGVMCMEVRPPVMCAALQMKMWAMGTIQRRPSPACKSMVLKTIIPPLRVREILKPLTIASHKPNTFPRFSGGGGRRVRDGDYCCQFHNYLAASPL